jgi:anti-sigma factor RsiW
MKECLEEGTIQAYVDGELSPSAAERVATHAGACAACASLLSEAENELALLMTAFEPELSLPVPSERLRERLDAAIVEARLEQNAPRATSSRNLKAWLASLVPSFNFAPRQALGFASLMAVVAFAVIFALVASRRAAQPNALAVVSDGQREMSLNAPVHGDVKEVATQTGGGVNIIPVSGKPLGNQTARRTATPSRLAGRVDKGEALLVADAKPLPGEDSYLKTISSLSSIIETNGENALKPSLRGEYERNLALVNHAIDATRRNARRNPKDPDAVDFLYSSYQSKIDLLSSVAEQGQMVAIAR